MGADIVKHYHTRRETRAMWALEYPVGDPFGGPAYGEYRDPVSATAMFATVIEAAPIFTAIGTALSVVGMVTGDKTLTSIGAVMGIAGGLTSYGASAGWFGDVATAAGANATGNVSAEAMNANEAAMGSDAVGGEAATAPTPVGNQPGIIQQELPPQTASPSPAEVVKNEAVGADGVGQGPQGPAAQAVSSAPTPPAQPTGTPENWGMDKGGTNGIVASNAQLNTAVNGMGGVGANSPDSIWAQISKAGEWMKANPMLTATAGAFIKGAFDGTTPAKIKQMNSQAGYYDAETNKLQQQTSFGNSVPNITGMMGVNPNANIYASRTSPTVARPGGGIINGVRA